MNVLAPYESPRSFTLYPQRHTATYAERSHRHGNRETLTSNTHHFSSGSKQTPSNNVSPHGMMSTTLKSSHKDMAEPTHVCMLPGFQGGSKVAQ
ncbi:unnamed protein product [Gadus morhua 'NCC']